MDVFHHFYELAILFAAIEACDWDTVAQVRSKGENVIVYDQCSIQIDAAKHTEVLIEWLLAPVGYSLGVLSEESMLDKCPGRVNFVDDWVGVPVVACREYGDLVIGVSSP